MEEAVNDSQFWMEVVRTNAFLLSEAKRLHAMLAINDQALALTQQNYDEAVRKYTNPFGVSKEHYG